MIMLGQTDDCSFVSPTFDDDSSRATSGQPSAVSENGSTSISSLSSDKNCFDGMDLNAVTPPSTTSPKIAAALPSVSSRVSVPPRGIAVTSLPAALSVPSPPSTSAIIDAISPPTVSTRIPVTPDRIADTLTFQALPVPSPPAITYDATLLYAVPLISPPSPIPEVIAVTQSSVAISGPSPPSITFGTTVTAPPSISSMPCVVEPVVYPPSSSAGIADIQPPSMSESLVSSSSTSERVSATPSSVLESVVSPPPSTSEKISAIPPPFVAPFIPSKPSITPESIDVISPSMSPPIPSLPSLILEEVPLTPPPLPPPASLEQPQIPISWPSDGVLSQDWILNMMRIFDWSSRNLSPSEFSSVFPVTVFDSLVLRASKLLHKEPNCVRIDPHSPNSSVVIVGDVHGQLHDVLFLLQTAGFPAEDRFYVFNGDYVDRGAWGLETLLILLGWKLILPKRVFLLRGNHESKYCTSVYGFEKEVMVKYGMWGKHTYRKCLGCFEGLPLASIIAGCVYTAHGGIFRSISVTSKRCKGKKNRRISINSDLNAISLGSLEELLRARRSVLDPPWEGPNLIPGDVLWSDPSMTSGFAPNTDRGIGLLWGPDCTEEFLKKFNLKLIIRSHEGPDARERRPGLGKMDEGYTIDHVVESGKLITLFSAPDYPQFQATEERYKNKGAYIVLEPPDFDIPVFYTFEAISPRPTVTSYYDFEDVIDSDEELDLSLMAPCS